MEVVGVLLAGQHDDELLAVDPVDAANDDRAELAEPVQAEVVGYLHGRVPADEHAGLVEHALDLEHDAEDLLLGRDVEVGQGVGQGRVLGVVLVRGEIRPPFARGELARLPGHGEEHGIHPALQRLERFGLGLGRGCGLGRAAGFHGLLPGLDPGENLLRGRGVGVEFVDVGLQAHVPLEDAGALGVGNAHRGGVVRGLVGGEAHGQLREAVLEPLDAVELEHVVGRGVDGHAVHQGEIAARVPE